MSVNFGHVGKGTRILDPHLSIFLKPEMITVGDYSRLDGLIKIEGGLGVRIGAHVHLASFVHVNAGGGEVVFGDNSTCSSHVVICGGMPDLSQFHVSAAELPENQHPRRMRTVIGEYVVIFAGAVICPGVTIGNRAVIGAGAVVTEDVPPGEIRVGVPARPIDIREYRERADLVELVATTGIRETVR